MLYSSTDSNKTKLVRWDLLSEKSNESCVMNSKQGKNQGIMLRILGIIGKLLDNFFFSETH